MSKKYKKKKQSKPKEIVVISADNIEKYIRLKYEIDDDGFWIWFFSDCPFRSTNILSLDLNKNNIPLKCLNYFKIIAEDFEPDAGEDGCLEIENDL